MQSMRFEKAKEKGNGTLACKAARIQRRAWRQVQNSAWDVPEEQRSAEAAEQTRWQAFVAEQDAQLEADCAKWRDEEEAERQVEVQVRLCKRFGREANKVKLQEERDADKAQLEVDCAKWRDEEEAERQVERRVRLRKRFGREASKAELQEECDADEAQVEANCAKWCDEEEAELRARFDAAEQEPGVAKLAVQLAVQDVSEPELDCVEQKAGQHTVAGQEVKEELRISVEASVAVVWSARIQLQPLQRR